MRVVATVDGQRRNVGAVVWVQVGQNQRIDGERVEVTLQRAKSPVAQIKNHAGVPGSDQIPGCRRLRSRDTTGAAQHRQQHLILLSIPRRALSIPRRALLPSERVPGSDGPAGRRTPDPRGWGTDAQGRDRKSKRLNYSQANISYDVLC